MGDEQCMLGDLEHCWLAYWWYSLGVGVAGAFPSGCPESLTLSVIDVGYGDSILVSTSDGHAMLVDGGPADASGRVLEAIRKAGVHKLDVLTSTHPHTDHMGGLGSVLDEILVCKVIDSGKVHTSNTHEGYQEKILAKDVPFELGRAESSFALGLATISILWPEDSLGENVHDCSVVVNVAYGEFSALLAGDIEAASEQALARKGALSQSTVRKVDRHASDTSTTSALLSVLRPAIAIISVGADGWGHPAESVIATLRASGARVYRTDLDGTVSVRTDEKTWLVESELGDEAPPDQKYYGSTNSDVFHYAWCSYVASIKAANLRVFNSRQERQTRSTDNARCASRKPVSVGTSVRSAACSPRLCRI